MPNKRTERGYKAEAFILKWMKTFVSGGTIRWKSLINVGVNDGGFTFHEVKGSIDHLFHTGSIIRIDRGKYMLTPVISKQPKTDKSRLSVLSPDGLRNKIMSLSPMELQKKLGTFTLSDVSRVLHELQDNIMDTAKDAELMNSDLLMGVMIGSALTEKD